MKTKKSKGNGPGKGNKALSTAVPIEIYEKIETLAEDSNLKVGKWAREVLTRAAKRNEVFSLQPLQVDFESLAKVAETPPDEGKVFDPRTASDVGGAKPPTPINYRKAMRK
jgi:hypothetical protein